MDPALDDQFSQGRQLRQRRIVELQRRQECAAFEDDADPPGTSCPPVFSVENGQMLNSWAVRQHLKLFIRYLHVNQNDHSKSPGEAIPALLPGRRVRLDGDELLRPVQQVDVLRLARDRDQFCPRRQPRKDLRFGKGHSPRCGLKGEPLHITGKNMPRSSGRTNPGQSRARSAGDPVLLTDAIGSSFWSCNVL